MLIVNRRAFQSPLGSISELVSMIKQVHRLFPDPSSLGSFLEFVAFIIDHVAVTVGRD